MTFAEVLFFCFFVALIYKLLSPVQKRLEGWIYRRIAAGKSRSRKPDIEVNDYKKTN